jgi:hypothetical protein
MPSRFRRPALAAAPVAAALSLALTVGTAAQVASLVGPEETPAPEQAETIIEYADRDEALLAYAQCMRDNGIDMDDPDTSGGRPGFFRGGAGDGDGGELDFLSEDFQAAQEACGDTLAAARPEVDPEAEQERLEEQLQLAQCIRDSGYPEYPDPAIGTDGRLERTRGQGFADIGIDPRSPEFQEVMGTCRDQLGMDESGFGPGGLGRGPGGN